MFFFPYELRIVHTHYQREIGDTKKGDFNMNKLFTKIAALFLGMTMAVGVGVAVGTSSKASEVSATNVTGTINFGSATGSTNVNAASVTGDDSQGNTWTITTVGTTSFTPNAAYAQIGASKKPATSITFTTTLEDSQTISSFSAKFGGFGGTAGTVTLKVSDTTVGTGSLNETNDVVVKNTSSAEGTVLTVTVTSISKGVKAYYVSYTYEQSTPVGPTKLETPTDLEQAGGILQWSTVDGASSYTVEYDESEIEGIEESIYELKNYTVGKHQFKVKAIGDGTNYSNSDWSELLKWDDRPKENIPVGEYEVTYTANGASSLPEDGDQKIIEDSATTVYKTFKLTSDKFAMYTGRTDEYGIRVGGYVQFQNESNATLTSIIFDVFKYNNLTCVASSTVTPSSSTSGDHLYLTYDFGSTNPEIVTFSNNSDKYEQGIYEITLNFEVAGTVATIAKTADLTKDTYTVGEQFSTAGLVITGTYTQGGTFDATSKCTYSPANGATLTQEYSKLTITYSASNSPTTTSGEDIVIEIDISVTFPSPSETIAAINAIGTVAYTQASYDLIKTARDLYNGLPAESQAGVTNIQTLLDAEDSFATLKTNAVNNVISLITAIGEVTLDSGDEIEAAETAYAALLAGDLGKGLVTNYSTLTAARTTYNKMVSDKEAADAVTAMINLLPTPSSITDYSHHADIVAARTAYDALTNDQKAFVSGETLQKLVDCETEDAKYEPTVLRIKHNQTTTAKMDADTNNAYKYFGLSELLWSVVSSKESTNEQVGLNADGTTRLYCDKTNGNGTKLTVAALDTTYTIDSIIIDFASNTKADNIVTVYSGSTVVTPVSGTYTINGSSFAIQNSSTASSNNQTWINHIDVYYSIEQSQTADAFLEAVEAIPAVADINAENLETVNGLIQAAETEYDKLTEDLKDDAEVIAAKTTLDAAKAKAIDVSYEVEAADTVAAITALPNPEDITDWSHHAAIVTARSMYEALSDNAKTKVTNIDKLIACEEAEAPYQPLDFDIDTDGGMTHGETDSNASANANTADALQSGFPVGTDLISWKNGSYAYKSNSNDRALKLGTGSYPGSVTLSFTHNRMFATTVTLDAYSWGGKTITLSVNGVTKTLSGYSAALTFDLTSVAFTGDVTIGTTTDSNEERVTIFGINIAYAYRADYSAAKTFETDFIKKDIAYPDVTPTGVSGTDCLSTKEGGKGYYDLAEARYNSTEFGDAARLEFATHNDFAKARERFQAWARANGKSITFNQETGAIEYNTRSITLPTIFGESSNATAIVVIVSVVSLTAIGGYFFLKKRREQN